MNRGVNQVTEPVMAQDVMTDAAFLELCAKGTAEEVRQALNNCGANIEAQDEQGMTVLMHAAKCNTDLEVMKVLLRAADEFNKKSFLRDKLGFRTVDIDAGNKDDKTALMFAVKNNSPEVVGTLLNAGADVSIKDKEGMMVLMYAARDSADPAVMKVLLDAAAEFNKKGLKSKLGFKTVDVDDGNKEGITALMFAVGNNSPETVQALLNAGAAVNIKDKQDMTALMWAAQRSSPKFKLNSA